MKVFIVGSGTMGAGIAQVFAVAENDVVLCDVSEEFVQKGYDSIAAGMKRQVDKGRIEQAEAGRIFGRITTTTAYQQAEDCDLVIEAITEDMALKKALFEELDKICGAGTILASNTSSISITELANCTQRKDKVIGMHFFNPAPVMKLVEVIRAMDTSDDACKKVTDIVRQIGKEPVEVNEAPGFVVNRILIPMINEAVMLLEQNVADAQSIDKAMALGANHPMGPLALADLIGNDVVLAIMDTLLAETGDSKYRAAMLLRKMVRGNKLGRKTKAGFYQY